MRRRLVFAGLLLGLAVLVFSLFFPVDTKAQSNIVAGNDQATIRFPDSVQFSVDLKSDVPISRVVLEYGVERLTCGNLVSQAFPQIKPSTTVKATWTWEMKQSGSQPPGAGLWWRWRVTTADGKEAVTTRQNTTWIDQSHPWKEIDGERINLHWYKGDNAFAGSLHDTSVKALADLAANVGLKPEAPVEIYIYATTQEMRDAILFTPGWTGGIAFSAHNIVAIGISESNLEWGKRALVHELTHVLFGHFTFTCLGSIPTWLSEGLARFSEGLPEKSSLAEFEEALEEDRLISVRALGGSFSESSDKADLSYTESYKLVDYLINVYGREKLMSLLLALKDGLTIDQAMRATMGIDLDGLEDAWRAKIGAKPRPIVRLIPTGTPTAVPTLSPFQGFRFTPSALSGSGSPVPVSPTPGSKSELPPSTRGFLPLPTATAYATSVPRSGSYVNESLGLTLVYPNGWTMKPGTSASTLAQFFAPQNEVVSTLITDREDPSESLATFGSEYHRSTLEALQDVKIESDQSITLRDGRMAWTTVATGVQKSGMKLKVNLTTTVFGGRLFLLLSLAPPNFFDAHLDEISQFSQSMSFKMPLVLGYPRDQILVLAGSESTNSRDYDPATTNGEGDRLVFSGLVSYDSKMNLVPELAESWKVKDGTVYTFSLRTNARFHNGRPFTAEDVVYSWERAADPKTGSDTVLTYLGDIVGVAEMRSGKASHIAGLRVLDEHTLEVTLDAPKPYFLLKLTYPTAFVLDRNNVNSGPEWYRTPNGTGPYRLVRWERMKQRLYERNDAYYLKPPSIPHILFNLYSGVGSRLYEAGDIDLTGVSASDVSRVLDPDDPLHKDVQSSTNLCTSYVVFDTTQPPFDDVKVRQAFALAIDRNKYLDIVMRGVGLAAKGLYPPALPGYNPDLKGQQFDPDRARTLLADSKYKTPAGLPAIVYTVGGSGSGMSGAIAAQVQMWQQTLGVTVTVQNLEPDKYFDELNAGRHGQLMAQGWCADYPDAENFADVLFHTGAEHNWGHYSNPRLDDLLAQARVEQDVAKRIHLYQEAEQLIIDDAAVAFVSHTQSYVLVKPYVRGYVITPVRVPIERELSIDPSKMN